MRFTRILVLAGLIALVAVPVALALRFTDESYFTPIGEVGKPYSHQFNGAGGCGPDPASGNKGLPYQYRILSGELPAGLSLSKDGKITGTPTAAGTANFWVELSDEDPPSQSWCVPQKAQREFSITIRPALSVQQNSLAPTYVNEAYSVQLTASGGGSQSWKIQSGTLPPGITFSTAGLLSGTPTTVGDYTFVVYVTDGTRSDIETLTLNVVQRLSLTATPAPGEVGLHYSAALTAAGGKPPYAFSVTGGALPAGVALDPATGTLAGTPTSAGTSSAVVTMKDALGLTTTANVNIVVAEKLAVDTAELDPAKEGKRYTARLETSGGVAPTTWRLLGRLPKGLHFSARTGVVAGVPAQHGTFRLAFTATDRLGAKARVQLRLAVTAALKVVTRHLPTAKEGKRYAARLKAKGGVPPTSWRLVGALPDGLRFNARTGVLSGVPKEHGSFTLRFVATDRDGTRALARLTLRIKPSA